MTNKPVALVTGGAGFIGSHMVDLLLEKGFTVRIVDNMSSGRLDNLNHHSKNSDISVSELDIRDIAQDSSIFKGVKYIFHFAGIGDIVPSIERPADYMQVNAMGTLKVLEAARWATVEKLVYAASSSCYGCGKTPTDENQPINILHPYALSKFQGEQIVMKWNEIYDLPCNSISCCNLINGISLFYNIIFCCNF